MLHESYAEVMEYNDDLSRFDFVSIGEKGVIKKRIEFRPSNTEYVYQLGFGDVLPNDEVSDIAVSDNGDRDKVLATVVRALTMFTNKYPDYWVHFEGSTDSRTRLYRMVITLRYKQLSSIFDIYGAQEGNVIPFKEGAHFTAFLFRKK